MSALKDIENALGLFDLAQMGVDVINEVFRPEDEITTDDDNRMNYYRDGIFLGSRTTMENDTEVVDFAYKGKALLIDAIEKRLHNIKLRLAVEQI